MSENHLRFAFLVQEKIDIKTGITQEQALKMAKNLEFKNANAEIVRYGKCLMTIHATVQHKVFIDETLKK